MRYEDDINTARRMETICRAAVLNDNAPDSEPLRHWFESTVEQQFLLFTLVNCIFDWFLLLKIYNDVKLIELRNYILIANIDLHSTIAT